MCIYFLLSRSRLQMLQCKAFYVSEEVIRRRHTCLEIFMTVYEWQ